MRLYLIKRRDDGKFFVNINGHCMLYTGKDEQYWSDKSQRFFKTPEGVAGNLRKLCSKPYWDTVPPSGICNALKSNYRDLAWRDFDKRGLDKYEVVVMDVNILSMTATPAVDFIQIDKIESQPLSSRERRSVP